MQKIVKNSIIFWSLFIVGVLIIILGVNFYFNSQKKEIKKAKYEELSSIAGLKIKEISEWYTDELSDASTIAGDKQLVEQVKDWLLNGNKPQGFEIEATLQQLCAEHGYRSVSLLSTDLTHLVSSDRTLSHFDRITLGLFPKVIACKKTVCSDLFENREDSAVCLDFIAPVFARGSEIIGVVVFRNEANDFLYPLLENWPVKSRTAETLLVRKEQDSVLFLNNLRHLPGAALHLRIPITRKDVPSVKAVLGYKGYFEGFDYRDKKVISYIDSIPGTPWYMVSKINGEELYDHYFFKTATPEILSIAGIILLLLFFYLHYVRQQKNFYKQLYLTQQEYKTTLYSIGDGVITTGRDTRVIGMNPVAERLTGWSEEDARGKKINDVFVIINEETREHFENPVKKVIGEGVIVGLANHTLLISKDGREIPISDSGAPIHDDLGVVTGVVLVFRDRTEERNQQRSLFEVKRKMSTLLSNLRGMAYRCKNDPDWTMEFVSKGCEELTGYSCWEVENNQLISYRNIIYPEDRGYVWEQVETALEKREPFQLEYRIVTKQGEIEWVWEQGLGIWDDQGRLEAIEGLVSNITSRKQAEMALYESEEIFNHFLEYSPIYIFFKDENIRSLKLSKNFEQMLGKPLRELLGKNMFELFPTDFARKMVEDDLEVLTRNEVITTEENFNGRNYLTMKFPVKIGGQQTYLAGFTIDITDRKQTEEALSVSEKLFQTLAENASVGIFRTNREGLTTYVNPKWCELSGAGREEALGVGWIDHVHEEDRAGVLAGWENATSRKGGSSAEYRFIHADGKVVWVKGDAVPELSESGEILGYVGTISDVTEILNSNEMIQRANNLLRMIIDNIPDAIYMKDNEGRKLIANKADFKNMGASSEEEVLGKTDFDFFTKEVASKLMEDDLMVLKNGIPIVQREEWLINLHGEEKWILTSKIPFRDKNKKIIGLVGIGHDITQRKKREEEMLKLTKALTQSPVSIVITDLNGKIEYVNPKFTEITGYTLEEAIGENPRILKSGAQSVEFYQDLWNTILSGSDWKGELQNRKKSGERYWESVIISPIVNETGKIINFVAIKEDVTEKKRMMGELIEAKEKAEESDKLKSAFLANMSHEIRTPLNSILGFSNFLTGEDELSKEEKEEYSNIINKSADGLLQIINDIIDISSLETGQLKTFIKPVNVKEILQSLYLVFSQKLIEINKSHIILEKRNSDPTLVVMADENRFIQIITNLVNNAMKFTAKGTISFGVESYDEKKVVFIVSDTGIGIHPEMHDSIFERFRQVETDKMRNFGGNGLGLAIVKNLVGLMGGEIDLESEVGKGSTFRFWLPRAKMNG